MKRNFTFRRIMKSAAAVCLALSLIIPWAADALAVQAQNAGTVQYAARVENAGAEQYAARIEDAGTVQYAAKVEKAGAEQYAARIENAGTVQYATRIRKAGQGGDDTDAGNSGQAGFDASKAVRLTDGELEELNESLAFEDNGFFLSTYTRPEEIAWSEVLYNGAGIDIDSEDPDYRYVQDYLEDMYGELVTGLFVLKLSDVRDLVHEKTGSDYTDSTRPVELDDNWDWFDGKGLVASLHGDTNYQPITFTKGYRDGDLYQLYYTASDPDYFFDMRDFVMTAEIKGGKWRFISNLPDAPDAPAQLARIDFYQTKAEAAEAAGSSLLDELEITYKDSNSSDVYETPKAYAVVTSLTDGLSFQVDRNIDGADDPVHLSSLAGIGVPDELIASYVMNAGTTLIFNAVFTFDPEIRISAFDGVRYGEYWVGDDLWKYIDAEKGSRTRSRVITGYARDLYPRSDSGLSAALAGSWIYYDPSSGVPKAFAIIDQYRDMEIFYIEHSGFADMWMGYQRTFAQPSQACDTVTLRVNEDITGFVPEGLLSSINGAGDYLVTMRQAGNAQILNLRQINNGDGVLSYLRADEDEFVYDFDFYRYSGRQTWKTEYKRILEETRIDAALRAEFDEEKMYTAAFDSWHLYDINKDGIPELFIKRGSYEADYRLEVYTIDEAGNAVLCTSGGTDEPVWFGHSSLYSCPEGNGVLIWEGHMGIANIRRMTLDGIDLRQELLLEEDITGDEEVGDDIWYTEPGELVDGSVMVQYFYPAITLPLDKYESWVADAGLSPAGRGESGRGGSAYSGTGSVSGSGAAGVFGYDEPDWFHDIQNKPGSSFTVCPTDVWLNDPGTMTVGDFLEQGVIYEYSPDNLIVQHIDYADLDGDENAEAVMYIGASDSQASQYRAIFHQQDGKVFAYTDFIFEEETLQDDGTFVTEDTYYGSGYRKKAVFDGNQCFFYEPVQ